MDVPVMENKSSQLCLFYDWRRPDKSEENNKEITNYTMRVQGIPICNATHCLNITL